MQKYRLAAIATTLLFAILFIQYTSDSASAQTALVAPPTPAQSLALLTPDERQQFDLATKDFSSEKYAEALTIYRSMLVKHPGDPLISKYSSEAALNTGDAAFAVKTLLIIEAANQDDWQAASLLARAYAESNDKPHRDAEMLRLADMQRRGITPPRLQQYLIEKVHAGDRTVVIFNSLFPWGNYKIYNFARVLDSQGHLLMLISLESSDFDQPSFTKEHPKEAAAGARSFSLDGYVDTGTNASGQKTQTHLTFKFFDGRPSYDTVRQEILSAATGKSSPMSNRTNLPVPQ